MGAMPPAQRSCPPFPPISMGLDQLQSFYCLFYVRDYSLKLSNDGCCKMELSGIIGNIAVKMFSGGQAPRSLCCLCGFSKDVSNIIEGVVIIAFLIGAPVVKRHYTNWNPDSFWYYVIFFHSLFDVA